MTTQPTEQCIRRGISRYTRCRCSTCIVDHYRTRKIVENGYAPRIPWQDGWAAFTALLDAGWSTAAIASACNLHPRTMNHARLVYTRGGTVHFGHVTCQRLLNPGTPTSGQIPSLAATRMVRALARIGWSTEQLAATAGVAPSTVSLIQAGRQRTAYAVVVHAITGTYDRLNDTIGTSPRAADRAHAAGWPPPYAWDDITDPATVPDGYPHADRPTPRTGRKRSTPDPDTRWYSPKERAAARAAQSAYLRGARDPLTDREQAALRAYNRHIKRP